MSVSVAFIRVASSWLMANYADVHLAQLRAANAGATQICVVEKTEHNEQIGSCRQ